MLDVLSRSPSEGFIAPASALALLLAFAVDRGAGELPTALHPVAWGGRLIAITGSRAPKHPPAPALIAGLLIAVVLPAATYAIALFIVWNLNELGALGVIVEGLLLSTTFASRALEESAVSVVPALRAGDLDAARACVSRICSRDTQAMSASDVSATALESAAENASDSIVAPLLWYVLLGLPGAACYRAINTLDAMMGYRGQWEHVGKASARLDDLVNIVPARLTAWLLGAVGVLASGRLAPDTASRTARIWWRDHANTTSPNGGHPMSTMAGLLGVRLPKPGHYVLGEGLTPANPDHVIRAVRLVRWLGYSTTALAAVAITWSHVAPCLWHTQGAR